MSVPLIPTKLYIPTVRPKTISRPQLFQRLSEGLDGKLTLITAPAGFGKTTLVSGWVADYGLPSAWLSLDERDNEPARFLSYMCAAFQSIPVELSIGALQAGQPLPIEPIMSLMMQKLAEVPHKFLLVLDDYHRIDSEEIDAVIVFLLTHMPAQMHLIIATREKPGFPLARLRAGNLLNELGVEHLRFTNDETTVFFREAMGLESVAAEDITLLQLRTEGWVAALQLAALSMQGQTGVSGYMQSFTGSHPYLADYLLEEVLKQQSEFVQTFLLRTSILDRICGSLCEAIVQDQQGAFPTSGQAMLEELERANLFLVPLDNERRWYRYHHLFAEMLRQRLQARMGEGGREIAELHILASQWYEKNGLEVEAFHHAVLAEDIERAARLAEGEGLFLPFRGEITPVVKWLESLSKVELDRRPVLWVMHASALLMTGGLSGVESKLQAAERVLQSSMQDAKGRDLIGHCASIRATLAVSRHQASTILTESRRALHYLSPDNLPVRTATTWTMGYAHQLQGDRVEAGRAYAEALSSSQRIGHAVISVMAMLGLGQLQEGDNQPFEAADTYRSVLELAGTPPLPAACEAYFGLARIHYEWNDLDTAMQHAGMSIQLARQLEHTDRVVAAELLLARLKLAKGKIIDAAALVAKAENSAHRHHFAHQLPAIASVKIRVLLQHGDLVAAAILASEHELRLSEACVYVAAGDHFAAAEILVALRSELEAKELQDELLKVNVALAVVLYVLGDKPKALKALRASLMLGEPGGYKRLFVDEGAPMRQLLQEAAAGGMQSDYIEELLGVFDAEQQSEDRLGAQPTQQQSESRTEKQLTRQQGESWLEAQSTHVDELLLEPLSGRELEVLRLIAQGLSNLEISEQLFIALTTVKGHNRVIFEKLQVKRRTEAVARARKYGLL
ncbi:LuxR C-terminal-related transcriptional regulator [Paenibacillus herberti]|uniref:LuxR family transcriptional regulator n=1 Tax=Paenibacillus herberti TaxID=1619309 RepID=A0A229P4C5_9BACL|nr:LuxR C-terminal-related transcriptional regulator [Paenibacillus herberti]OXM16960.1 LuxR family transcriptional regulator [Paenibacillus herberti]